MTDLPKIDSFKHLSIMAPGPYWTLYEATHRDSDTRHMLQVLDPQLSANRNVVYEFENLYHYNKGLKHPFILTPQSLEISQDKYYLVYEPFKGHSLRGMRDSQIPILERQVLSLSKHVASALQYAQIRGIKHGFLTPEFILLSKYSDEVKIFGFGSQYFFEHLYTSGGAQKNKLAEYLPPESLTGRDIPETDDSYALGVLLYQAMLSTDPFKGESLTDLRRAKQQGAIPPHDINPKVSPKLSEIVSSLIDPIPQKRTTLGTLLNYMAPEPEHENGDEEIPPPFSGGPIKRALPFAPQKFVGSKRRVAYSVLTAVIFLSVLISAVMFTQLSTSDTKRMQVAYEEFLAEGRTQRQTQPPENEQESALPLEQDTLFERNAQVLDTLNSDVSTQEQEPVAEQPEPVEEKETEAVTPSPEPAPTTTTLRIAAFSENEPVDADVFLNGNRVGQLSPNGLLEIPDLRIGSGYTVKVVKPGFEPWERTIRLRSAPVTSLRAELVEEEVLGKSITIADVPFATHIQLADGQLFELPATLNLTFGSHLINFIERNVDFLWRTQITITETSPEKIVINPESVGTGELLVVLENPIEYGYAYVSVNGNPEHTTPYKFQLSAGQHRVRIFRQGYRISPSDTTVFVRPNEDTVLRCLVQ